MIGELRNVMKIMEKMIQVKHHRWIMFAIPGIPQKNAALKAM